MDAMKAAEEAGKKMKEEQEEEKTEVGSELGEKSNEECSATLAQMFSEASSCDWVFMAVGSFGAVVTGASIPAFNILLGEMLDT
jgi:hypothetical protein